MKSGTHNHVKTKRLMRLLGLAQYQAVGLIETLYLLCADECDDGLIGRFADEEIAAYAGWDGKQTPLELVTALATAGWLESHAEHRWKLFEWEQVKKDYRLPRAVRDHADPEVAAHTVAVQVRIAVKAGLPATLKPDEWLEVLASFGNACAYCGAVNVPLQLEHMIPVIRGGGTERTNIVPACRPCNNAKGRMTPLEFLVSRDGGLSQ